VFGKATTKLGQASYQEKLPVPFIVGVPRSGTTLVRLLLDAHPDLAIPPETGFLDSPLVRMASRSRSRSLFAWSIKNFPWNAPLWPDFEVEPSHLQSELNSLRRLDLKAGLEAFYRSYSATQGKSRWGDKTPGYTGRLGEILKVFPEAKIVHVVRDGRDVAASLRYQTFSPTHDLAELAKLWANTVHNVRHSVPQDSLIEIRFEDVILRPQEFTDKISSFLNLRTVGSLDDPERRAKRLQQHRPRRTREGQVIAGLDRAAQQATTAGAMQTDKIGVHVPLFSRDDLRRFNAIAGKELKHFGYLQS
jgi:Sulfotransferase family